MELMPKPRIKTLLFLLLLLAVSCLSSDNIYEIDYRGPETHSHYRPPPGRSGHMPFIQGHTRSSKTKGLKRGATVEPQYAREVHG